jgi:hypothetical protein
MIIAVTKKTQKTFKNSRKARKNEPRGPSRIGAPMAIKIFYILVELICFRFDLLYVLLNETINVASNLIN